MSNTYGTAGVAKLGVRELSGVREMGRNSTTRKCLVIKITPPLPVPYQGAERKLESLGTARAAEIGMLSSPITCAGGPPKCFL